MPIYEKEFYRRNTSHGHFIVWSLRFDSESGVLTVMSQWTSGQGGKIYASLEDFKANCKDTMALRMFRGSIERLPRDAGMTKIDSRVTSAQNSVENITKPPQ